MPKDTTLPPELLNDARKLFECLKNSTLLTDVGLGYSFAVGLSPNLASLILDLYGDEARAVLQRLWKIDPRI